jgi:hypothetical protein
MTNSIECQIENCGPSFAMPPILPSVARSKPSSILLRPSLQRLRRPNRLSEALHQKQRDLVEARPCLQFEGGAWLTNAINRSVALSPKSN